MSKIMFIAPHPDDESLGCGGTILKYRANGHSLFWLIVTQMDKKEGWSKKKIDSREKEINQVSKLYNFEKTIRLDYPAAKLDSISFSEIIRNISGVFAEIRPETIFVPHPSDIHTDHAITFNACFNAAKTFRSPFIKRILAYETISETEHRSPYNSAFFPNLFINISPYFEKKLKIIKTYKHEIRAHPFPRSTANLKALATFRGSMCNCLYAESFHLIRSVE